MFREFPECVTRRVLKRRTLDLIGDLRRMKDEELLKFEDFLVVQINSLEMVSDACLRVPNTFATYDSLACAGRHFVSLGDDAKIVLKEFREFLKLVYQEMQQRRKVSSTVKAV